MHTNSHSTTLQVLINVVIAVLLGAFADASAETESSQQDRSDIDSQAPLPRSLCVACPQMLNQHPNARHGSFWYGRSLMPAQWEGQAWEEQLVRAGMLGPARSRAQKWHPFVHVLAHTCSYLHAHAPTLETSEDP